MMTMNKHCSFIREFPIGCGPRPVVETHQYSIDYYYENSEDTTAGTGLCSARSNRKKPSYVRKFPTGRSFECEESEPQCQDSCYGSEDLNAKEKEEVDSNDYQNQYDVDDETVNCGGTSLYSGGSKRKPSYVQEFPIGQSCECEESEPEYEDSCYGSEDVNAKEKEVEGCDDFENQYHDTIQFDEDKENVGDTREPTSICEDWEPEYQDSCYSDYMNAKEKEEDDTASWPPCNFPPGNANGSSGYGSGFEDDEPKPKRRKSLESERAIIMGLVAPKFCPWIDAKGKLKKRSTPLINFS